ncbi:MAG TPA: ribosome-associated heat shock protein Hsp15 [Candidatus Avisuccinivibrio pullicola]|nr:ribosome-associated heat shock protein Hsp15 [Candidatus Avisuccinivibrio pullicola]
MAGTEAESKSVRLDKWLWAARFYKTRSIAREMIEGGKVDYNGSRAKPSRTVEVGARVRLLQGNDRREIIIRAISDVRGPASVAQTLYEETPESIQKREELQRIRKMAALIDPRPDTRPNKKERRALLSLKEHMAENFYAP